MNEQDKDFFVPERTDASQETSPPPDTLAPEDIQALERANVKRQIAVARANQAVAESETADLQYKNVVMQLFLKYGLSARDSITPEGLIKRVKG